MRKTYTTLLFFGVIILTACASAFMKGGDLVPMGYKPLKVEVMYSAQGTVPQGVEYLLVETDKGLAMFERSGDGSGTLFLTRWKDSEGDHFAGWVAGSHAYEFVVPKDWRKNAKKYVYPAGTYELKTIDDVKRPVPAVKVDPVATLIPER